MRKDYRDGDNNLRFLKWLDWLTWLVAEQESNPENISKAQQKIVIAAVSSTVQRLQTRKVNENASYSSDPQRSHCSSCTLRDGFPANQLLSSGQEEINLLHFLERLFQLYWSPNITLKHRTKQKPQHFMTPLLSSLCRPCSDHREEFQAKGYDVYAVGTSNINIILFNKSFSVLLRKHHPSCIRIPIYQANILAQCQTGN